MPLFDLGRYFDTALDVLKTCLLAAQRAGDVRGQAVVLCHMGEVRSDRLEHVQALDHLQESRKLFEDLHDRHGQGRIDARLAMMQRLDGNDDAALSLYREALPILHEFEDHADEVLALRAIGQIHLKRGAHADADAYFARALRICRTIGARRPEAQVLYWQGVLRLEYGLAQQAETAFQDVLDVCRRFGDVPGQVYSLKGLSSCYQQRGDLRRAKATLSEALRIVRQPRPTKLELDIRQSLVKLAGHA